MCSFVIPTWCNTFSESQTVIKDDYNDDKRENEITYI